MSSVDIVAMATQLAAADPASADRTGLGRLVSLVQQSRAWLDALDVRIGIAADRLAHEGRSEPAAELLSDDGRRSSREARAAGRRAGLCATIPAAHDALAAGHVTAGHVDALADTSSKLSASEQSELRDRAPELVASARNRSIRDFQRDLDDTVREIQADDGTSRLERQRAARNVARRVDRVTGMCRTSLELDPVTDATVWTAINAQIKSRQAASGATDHWQHTAVDAIVDLVTGAQAVSTRVPDVIVHIDVDTLVDGPHPRTLCGLDDGQPIPVTTVRRLACDANLIPVVLDGDGVVLDLGRGRRLASPEQRTALRAMYAGCGFPGCDVPFDRCEVHHVEEWKRHLGPTDLDRLIPLCRANHHPLVHEQGWRLDLAADRTLTVTRPDGTAMFTGSTINRGRPPPRAPAA